MSCPCLDQGISVILGAAVQVLSYHHNILSADLQAALIRLHLLGLLCRGGTNIQPRALQVIRELEAQLKAVTWAAPCYYGSKPCLCITWSRSFMLLARLDKNSTVTSLAVLCCKPRLALPVLRVEQGWKARSHTRTLAAATIMLWIASRVV